MLTIHYDDSLSAFLKSLHDAGIDVSEAGGIVIRDMRGRLTFVAKAQLSSEVAERVEGSINLDLRPYISPIGAISDQTAPGAARIFAEPNPIKLNIDFGPQSDALPVRLLDRRAVGGDWLRPPVESAAKPPRLVFASFKGGVGRSTSLAVLSAEISTRGRSALVIDLDLEAPGIGSMLVERDATPTFGSIDFFVESGLKPLDEVFITDCVGTSWVGTGKGRIDVIPALGSRSLDRPQGVLSKLARAYLDQPVEDGPSKTFLDKVRDLIERATLLRRYDAVLIDARAGMHETTAAAILGLGADVLLFGTAQPQTQTGLELLLSHLALFPSTDENHDWRDRLRIAQAKAEPHVLDIYRGLTFDIFDKYLYQHDGDPLENFSFGLEDENAPHYPVPIFEDERFRLFDPISERSQLTEDLYRNSFGRFLDFCLERLQLDEEDGC
jgi:cellulose biosynthesis protein BcsQ